MTETPIDLAHNEMQAKPEDDTRRLRFYERLADAELFLLLENEATGDSISPRVFDTEDGRFVLAFDRETRLTEFAGGPAPYAALSGRNLATMLSEQALGLGLNLGTAPSETLIPPDALEWLKATLADTPDETEETPETIHAPSGLPESLITALDTKLATAAGRAPMAYLASVTWSGGGRGHVLAFIDAVPGAEPALAQAVREALVFSGLEAGALDVTFLRASSPVAARLAKLGLRFDLPALEYAAPPGAPGMDPDRPPKLF